MQRFKIKNSTDKRVFILKKRYKTIGLFEIEGSEKWSKYLDAEVRDTRVIRLDVVEEV